MASIICCRLLLSRHRDGYLRAPYAALSTRDDSATPVGLCVTYDVPANVCRGLRRVR